MPRRSANPLPENYRNFPFLIFDDNDPHAGLRCVACKICEKECPPQCIYIVKSEDRKPDYTGQTAVLSEDVRHRYLGLHELPDLRRGVSIRGDQDGQGIRAESARAVRSLAFAQRATFKSNGYYHKIHPVEAEAVDKGLCGRGSRRVRRRRKAAAEAAAKAAAAKAAAAANRCGETSGRRAVAITCFFLSNRAARRDQKSRRWDVLAAYRSARDIQTSSFQKFLHATGVS